MSGPNTSPGGLALDTALAQFRLLAHSGAHSASEFSDLRARIDIELAHVARSRNAAISLQSRLPVELWSVVWKDLPLVDRMSLLRLCSAWRNFALGNPGIWSCIDVEMDVHHYDCPCDSCTDEARASDDFTTRYLAPACRLYSESNLHLVRRALALGKDVPVDLQLSDTAFWSSSDAHKYLGELLRPQARRLRTICLDIKDNFIVKDFLWALGHLTALDSLTITCDGENCGHPSISIAGRAIDCPSIKNLRFASCITWEPTRTQTMSLLRNLSCTVSSLGDVVIILDTCTSLSRLELELEGDPKRGSDPFLPLGALTSCRCRERALSLKGVTLRGVTPDNERDILSIFGSADVATLDLWYYEDEGPTARALEQLAGHLGGITTLLCAPATRGGLKYHTFKLLPGVRGTHRAIVQRPTLLHRIWKRLVNHLPRSIIIDASLWRTLITTDSVKPMPSIAIFTLLVMAADDLIDFPPAGDLLPRLQGVIVRGNDWSLAVSADSLASAVQSLIAPGCDLDSLVISGLTVDGDDAALRQKAQSVDLPIGSGGLVDLSASGHAVDATM